jgi:hypothetical protein
MNRLYRLGLLLILLLAMMIGTRAHAATSYETWNIPPTRLKVRINTTQTTGIKLNPPKRNGVNFTWPAGTGGVLLLEQGTRSEHIYFSSATVDSSKVVTLGGTVIRDLCPNNLSYIGCGNGQIFTPGAAVTYAIDMRTLNLAAKKDRGNIFTNSGSIVFSGSGTFRTPFFLTNATRDQQIPSPQDGQIIYHSGTGAFQGRIGGAWLNLGTTSISNATDAVSGKVQMTTLDHLQNATGTGATGAQNTIGTRWVVKNGSGTVSKGRIPQLNHNGVISTTLGGTGTGGLRGIASGALLFASGTGALKPIYPGANGKVLRSNGTVWGSGTDQDSGVLRDTRIAAGGTFGASNITRINIGSGTMLSGSTLANGDVIHLVGQITQNAAAGVGSGALYLGGTLIWGSNDVSLTGTSTYDFMITIRDADSSGGISVNGLYSRNGTFTAANQQTTGINFTNNLRLQWSVKFTQSDAGNSAQENTFVPILIRRTY